MRWFRKPNTLLASIPSKYDFVSKIGRLWLQKLVLSFNQIILKWNNPTSRTFRVFLVYRRPGPLRRVARVEECYLRSCSNSVFMSQFNWMSAASWLFFFSFSCIWFPRIAVLYFSSIFFRKRFHTAFIESK